MGKLLGYHSLLHMGEGHSGQHSGGVERLLLLEEHSGVNILTESNANSGVKWLTSTNPNKPVPD